MRYDVARADLAGSFMSLVVTVDPVARVGEPDRAIGALDEVVGTVKSLPVVAVGQHCDRPIVFGSSDTAMTLLTAHQAPLPIDGVAVGVTGRCAELADRAGQLVESQHPVVRDVAEQQIAARWEVRRPLRPATARVQTCDPLVPLAPAKPLVYDLEPRPDPIRHGHTLSAACRRHLCPERRTIRPRTDGPARATEHRLAERQRRCRLTDLSKAPPTSTRRAERTALACQRPHNAGLDTPR